MANDEEDAGGGVHPAVTKWLEGHRDRENIKKTLDAAISKIVEDPEALPIQCLPIAGRKVCLIRVETFTVEGESVLACFAEDAEAILSDSIQASGEAAKALLRWCIEQPTA